MRFLSSLATGCALVAGAFASERSSEERYMQFTRLSQITTPLVLNDASYKTLTATPRDYSVAIALTALESRFGCQLCRDFNPEWNIVANSWWKGDRRGDSRLFFATLDFTEGRDIFLSVCDT